MAGNLVHGWRCQKCGDEYRGLLQLHTCQACHLRGGYVLRWSEVTFDALLDGGAPLGEHWTHDVHTGRSRYWHDEG